ncbi:mediator-associated protein 2 [Quillaja saponaria]|uniref:Mediator-associated protein 2 n=1 Tax=Quillaja saponaria TaxID=32244 RepID=A0AAD7Q1C6_QUISA|nr:mediator-associated protein 2 [Quillaja saponaria]KAJ7972987.1 mediator-associated protein 2 [Quillaja saponaria]
MDVSNEGAYKCPPEFEVDAKEPLLNLSLTDSTELWLVQLPYSQDSLADIDGKELSLNLHHDGQLGSFEGLSGKQYDLVSSASQVPDATVFVSSATKQKIVGKISRRVSLVHYPGPKDLENVNSNKMKQYQNSSGAMLTKSSSYFPLQSSQSKHATSSQGSRHKSSLSEVGEPSKSSKRSSSKSNMSEDQSSQETSNRRIDRKSSRSMDQSNQYSEHGHSAATSSMSSEHSRGEKSKKRVKRKE